MENEESKIDTSWSPVLFVDYVSVSNEYQVINAGCLGHVIWGPPYSLSLSCYEPNMQNFKDLQALIQPGAVLRVEKCDATIFGSSLMTPEVQSYEGDAGPIIQLVNEWKSHQKIVSLAMEVFEVDR